jgi:prepilin peptidase CpaA
VVVELRSIVLPCSAALSVRSFGFDPAVVCPEWWISGIVGSGAVIEDLWRRSISNWFPVAALSGGLLHHGWAAGWSGLAEALLGAVYGFGIFLLFYRLGGMGGGDVKLMAGFGAVLGESRILQAAFWTALTGGILAAFALGYSAWRRRRNPEAARLVFIPYAPAIVAGVWLALLSSPN